MLSTENMGSVAVGDVVDIAVDLHRRLSPTMAVILVKELEPFRLLFAEEPCPPEHSESLLMFFCSMSVPLATGERRLTRRGFREVFEREMYVITSNTSHCVVSISGTCREICFGRNVP